MARSLIDPSRYAGTITLVTASVAHANLPYATARPERRALARGTVGDFVFVDCETAKLLGRIIEVSPARISHGDAGDLGKTFS